MYALHCRFGWKLSPYIYHTVGLAASGFLRAQGASCSLYMDDRLNGDLLTTQGPWSLLPAERSTQFRMDAAKVVIYVVLSVLVSLGYTIGIKKSVLWPTTSLEFLGLIVDSEKQSFLIPRSKIDSFAVLREHIISSKSQVSYSAFRGNAFLFLWRFQRRNVSSGR